MEGSAALKTELYVQLLKQLSENPNPASEAKGWELLALLLSCFAPPEIFADFVAMFIRKQVILILLSLSLFPYINHILNCLLSLLKYYHLGT